MDGVTIYLIFTKIEWFKKTIKDNLKYFYVSLYYKLVIAINNFLPTNK